MVIVCEMMNMVLCWLVLEGRAKVYRRAEYVIWRSLLQFVVLFRYCIVGLGINVGEIARLCEAGFDCYCLLGFIDNTIVMNDRYISALPLVHVFQATL